MKKLVTLLLAAMMLLTVMTAVAEEKTVMNWAYGAMPLNNGNVGTIYYTTAYYELEGIVNPANPEYAPYTAEEIAAIKDGAVEGAEGYRFDAPDSDRPWAQIVGGGPNLGVAGKGDKRHEDSGLFPTVIEGLVEEGGKLKINVHNLLTGKIMDTFTFAPRKRRRSRLQ